MTAFVLWTWLDVWLVQIVARTKFLHEQIHVPRCLKSLAMLLKAMSRVDGKYRDPLPSPPLQCSYVRFAWSRRWGSNLLECACLYFFGGWGVVLACCHVIYVCLASLVCVKGKEERPQHLFKINLLQYLMLSYCLSSELLALHSASINIQGMTSHRRFSSSAMHTALRLECFRCTPDVYPPTHPATRSLSHTHTQTPWQEGGDWYVFICWKGLVLGKSFKLRLFWCSFCRCNLGVSHPEMSICVGRRVTWPLEMKTPVPWWGYRMGQVPPHHGTASSRLPHEVYDDEVIRRTRQPSGRLSFSSMDEQESRKSGGLRSARQSRLEEEKIVRGSCTAIYGTLGSLVL